MITKFLSNNVILTDSLATNSQFSLACKNRVKTVVKNYIKRNKNVLGDRDEGEVVACLHARRTAVVKQLRPPGRRGVKTAIKTIRITLKTQ